MSVVTWTPAQIASLAEVVTRGDNRTEYAKQIGRTRCAVAGAVRRYITMPPPTKVARPPRHSSRSEDSFFEPWAVYHARKVGERAVAKAERMMELA